MIQRHVPVTFLLLGGCLLFLFFCASNAIADRNYDLEREANIRSENILPTGWINSISPESTVINDTHYIFTDNTRFLSAKRKLKEGVFVQFKLSEDNIIATIDIAEPQEKDMFMKPIIRSESEPRPRKSPSHKMGLTWKMEFGLINTQISLITTTLLT